MNKQLFPFSRNTNIKTKTIGNITDYGFINEYGVDIIDLGLGSSGCFPLGFKRTDIIDNVNEKLKQMPFCQSDFATTNEYVNELSERLYELSGGYSVIYSMSGSDSIEGAIKLAKLYNPERNTIYGFENSYHGSTYMSASVSGSTYLTDTFGKDSNCKILNDLSDIDDNTLAVIIETISWQNGLIEYEHWVDLRDKCDQHNVLLIIDDIAFCNGKTGTYFGWQKLPIKPDIFCIGKGITGGYYPLSATLMNSKVSDIVRDKVLLHGFAYSFPMSGIISSLEFLKILENEQILQNHDNIVNSGKQLAQQLIDNKLIKGYRNYGVCFNLLLNEPMSSLQDKDELFYKNGLHIGVWNNYREGILIMLPLNASSEYFDNLYERLYHSLS